MTLIPCGQSAERGSEGPPPRPRPQDDHEDLRTSDGEGELRPVAVADISAPGGWPRGNITTDERREGERGMPHRSTSRNGRGKRQPARTAAQVCRRGRAAGRGGGGEDSPLQRSAPRVDGRAGTLLRRSRNGHGDCRPARHVAADKRRGGKVDTAFGLIGWCYYHHGV